MGTHGRNLGASATAHTKTAAWLLQDERRASGPHFDSGTPGVVWSPIEAFRGPHGRERSLFTRRGTDRRP